jgi:hypothetical protein
LFELFSAKQVEIIEKLLHNDPLSKTEREYYTYVIFKRQLPKGLYRFMEIPTDNKHRPEAGLQSFDRLGNVHTEGRKIDSDFDGSSVLSEIMDGVRILGSVN